MQPLMAAALELQEFLSQQGWEFCFIGGIALQRWGHPRVTVDADVTLLTELGQEDLHIEPLMQRFTPRRPDAREFALQARVLLLQSSEGISLDVALAAFPFERRIVARASDQVFDSRTILRVCSAEDLVVLKAFADRPRDWGDIEGVLIRQGPDLDRNYIVENLSPLCELKEAPEIVAKLRAMFDQIPPS